MKWTSRLILKSLVIGVLSTSVAYSVPPCPCPGDIDGDCDTDVFDFGLFALAFGTSTGDSGYLAAADLDVNGTIDVLDFALFAPDFGCIGPSYYGNPNPHEPGELEYAVPERSTTCSSEPWARSQVDSCLNGVYAFSGEARRAAVDMVVRGRVMDFVWARKYRSQIGPNTAQGNGWDYSYNIFLEADGANFILQNGWARCDGYELQPSGTWIAPDFFREIEQLPDTSYLLHFPDTGHWAFHPLDGSPTEGKINRIEDRNGNTISFTYDGSGQLVTVTDDLGRNYTITYNPDGLIESVTDFTGRQVVYEYYNDGDAGGSSRDLKSARSPTVTGTPNGNDFPLGKTTVYTYTTGFSDELLNHNLLTVSDPKGQTYLQYEYTATTNRTDLVYDRVLRQTWGDPGDLIDLHYETIAPNAANNDSTLVTVLNLRRGNVKEVYSDGDNRIRMCREYTGFAPDPNAATTLVVNRPAGQLRPSDPAFYETQWDYSPDGKPTLVLYPNLNETQLTYDAFNAARSAQGNLLERLLLPGPLGGDQVQRVETFEYEPGFGGCCGTNFVSRHVDFRGNETLHTYDASGNRLTTTHRIPSIVYTYTYNGFGQLTSVTHPDNGSGYNRLDSYTYYAMGSQAGYLAAKIIDANGVADTTVHEYNDRGFLTRRIDPQGADELFHRNQLDQVVRTESRAVTTPNGLVRYQRDYFFDANDNTVQIDIQNIDDQGLVAANSHYTTIYSYDILNARTSATEEESAGHSITTNHLRDEHRHVRLIEYGEATSGADLANTLTMEFDERDLTFRRIRASGHADQSTDEFAYDGNRNVVQTAGGLEGTPRIRARVMDGYDRVVSESDPMGNVTLYEYDPNSNTLSSELMGELADVPGSAGNQLLESQTWVYDFMDRREQEDRGHFDPVTTLPIGDGQSTTTWAWTDTSQVQSVTNDNSHTWTYVYDTKLRTESRADPANNVAEYVYDGNDEVLVITETDRSTSGAPDQIFTTTLVYDEEQRVVAVTDNVGNTATCAYDSRDDKTLEIDARGNRTTHTFDGIRRQVATEHQLTDDGTGGGLVIGSILTTTGYDDSHRVVARTDDNGNTTQYIFDPLNRATQVTYADGTTRTSFYDPHDNITQTIDQSFTIRTRDYDLNDRGTRMDILLLGGGVSNDTTFQEYVYESRGLIVTATDDDSVVTVTHDSLRLPTSETRDGQSTTREHDGVGNVTECVYPGGRTISRSYDANERVNSVSDLLQVLSVYEYVGGRVESRTHPNDTILEYTYDGVTGVPNSPGDFGVRRVNRTLHRNTVTMQVFEDRRYRWDPSQNKISRRDVHPGPGPRYRHEYENDSVDRLRRTEIFDAGNNSVRDTVYQLDGVHNRTNVIGGLDPGAYTLDPTLPSPGDFQMNQYTDTPLDARGYDERGNLGVVDLGQPTQRIYEYNCDNLMTRCIDSASGQIHEYRYDALGKRIATVLDVGGANIETRYYYCGAHVCEEQDALGTTLATYVYGRAVDEVITMQRGGTDYFFHQDDLGNVMAVTDGAGAVVERYEYDDYGRPLAPSTLNPVGGSPSSIGNPYLFTGRRFDAESGLYWYRTRYMDPLSGRFLSRDSAGMWGDDASHGNGLAYSGSNPWTLIDPTGMAASLGDFLVWGYRAASGINALRKARCEYLAYTTYSRCISQCEQLGGSTGCCEMFHLSAMVNCMLSPSIPMDESAEFCCSEPSGRPYGGEETQQDCSSVEGYVEVSCGVAIGGVDYTCDCMYVVTDCYWDSEELECKCGQVDFLGYRNCGEEE